MVNPVRDYREKRKRFGVSSGVKKTLLIILFLFSVQISLLSAQPLWAKTPEMAPDFTLSDLENKNFSLLNFRGKPMILFFWTTWCPYCRKELKVLNNMYADLMKDEIAVLAINVGEPHFKVDNFIKSYGLLFEVLLDKETTVAGSYGIIGIPTYILIDRRGYIVFESNDFPQGYKNLISK